MPLPRSEKLARIRQTRIVAIMRAQSSEQLMAAANAIKAGGIDIIEVTMTTPGALDVIRTATAEFGDDVLFGAGSVLDPETARAAILAGAGFVVAPTLKVETIALCNRYGIPVMPGCYTPTECLTAYEAGADMVKLFPADVGGPAYLKAIRAPLPQLELVAVGGVDLDNIADFLAHGAAAVGLGGSLINQALLDRGDLTELTRRAEAFVAKVRSAA